MSSDATGAAGAPIPDWAQQLLTALAESSHDTAALQALSRQAASVLQAGALPAGPSAPFNNTAPAAAAGPASVVLLHASPLMLATATGPMPLESLNLAAERRLFTKIVSASGHDIAWHACTATAASLSHWLASADILCICCHAVTHADGRTSVLLDSPSGAACVLSESDVRALVRSAQAQHARLPRAVLLLACTSEDIATAMVQSGIPVVISVRRGHALNDSAGRTFAKACLTALLAGQSAAGAVAAGESHVKLRGDARPAAAIFQVHEAWAGAAGQPGVPLPLGGAQRARRAPFAVSVLPPKPRVSRQAAVSAVLHAAMQHRLVTALGGPAMGKQRLLSCLAHYLVNRRDIKCPARHGLVWVRLPAQADEAQLMAALVVGLREALPGASQSELQRCPDSSAPAALTTAWARACEHWAQADLPDSDSDWSDTEHHHECARGETARGAAPHSPHVLVCLPGIASNVCGTDALRRCVKALLSLGPHVRVLASAQSPLLLGHELRAGTGHAAVSEHLLHAPHLTPSESVDLLLATCPRALTRADVPNYTAQHANAVEVRAFLAEQMCIRLLHGHAGAIVAAASALSTKTLPELEHTLRSTGLWNLHAATAALDAAGMESGSDAPMGVAMRRSFDFALLSLAHAAPERATLLLGMAMQPQGMALYTLKYTGQCTERVSGLWAAAFGDGAAGHAIVPSSPDAQLLPSPEFPDAVSDVTDGTLRTASTVVSTARSGWWNARLSPSIRSLQRSHAKLKLGMAQPKPAERWQSVEILQQRQLVQRCDIAAGDWVAPVLHTLLWMRAAVQGMAMLDTWAPAALVQPLAAYRCMPLVSDYLCNLCSEAEQTWLQHPANKPAQPPSPGTETSSTTSSDEAPALPAPATHVAAVAAPPVPPPHVAPSEAARIPPSPIRQSAIPLPSQRATVRGEHARPTGSRLPVLRTRLPGLAPLPAPAPAPAATPPRVASAAGSSAHSPVQPSRAGSPASSHSRPAGAMPPTPPRAVASPSRSTPSSTDWAPWSPSAWHGIAHTLEADVRHVQFPAALLPVGMPPLLVLVLAGAAEHAVFARAVGVSLELAASMAQHAERLPPVHVQYVMRAASWARRFLLPFAGDSLPWLPDGSRLPPAAFVRAVRTGIACAAWACVHTAHALLWRAQYSEAAATASVALTLTTMSPDQAGRLRHPELAGYAHRIQAAAAVAQNQPEQAQAAAAAARTAFRRVKLPLAEACAWLLQAMAMCQRGMAAAAEKCVRHAGQLAAEAMGASPLSAYQILCAHVQVQHARCASFIASKTVDRGALAAEARRAVATASRAGKSVQAANAAACAQPLSLAQELVHSMPAHQQALNMSHLSEHIDKAAATWGGQLAQGTGVRAVPRDMVRHLLACALRERKPGSWPFLPVPVPDIGHAACTGPATLWNADMLALCTVTGV